MIVLDGREVHYEERGSGAPVLFVPGSYSTASAWRGVASSLGDDWRQIGTSLNGYGNSAETRTDNDLAITHGVRLIESLVAHIGEPVHLVGHSFGGYLSLAAAMAGNIELRSLSLFEANPIPLLRTDHPQLFRIAENMTDDFAAALARNDADAARLIIDFWGEPGAFDAMPPAVQDYCRSTTAANLLDWHGAMAAQIDISDCSRIDCKVLLVRGGRANPLIVAITDLLAAHLPKVQPVVVDNAGHFLIASHAQQCGELLKAFIND